MEQGTGKQEERMTLPNDPIKREEYLKNLKLINVGRKASEETRKKISESLKGNTRTLGYKHSVETKQKLSDSHKNISEETRKKISDATRGENNPMWGKHHSKEAREKISAAKIGKPPEPFTKEHCEKIGNAHRGKVVSEETKQKLREINIGKSISEETRLKISIANKGKIVSEETKKKLRGKICSEETRLKLSIANKGRIISDESKRKQSITRTGKKASEETKLKMRESRKLEGNSRWLGGVSFKPYCIKFNDKFKERVRAFFNYTCVECGIKQTTKKLDVHHVNFDKNTCCNNSTPLFVSLCRTCHMKTNKNREFWEQHFTELINSKYNGCCYISNPEDY